MEGEDEDRADPGLRRGYIHTPNNWNLQQHHLWH